MAVRTLTNLVGNITNKDRFPRQEVVLRCLENKFGPSQSSGNPMITLEWEIIHPESVTINGEVKNIMGVKPGSSYFPTIVLAEDKSRNNAKSDAALARLRDFRKAVDLPADEIDDENPTLDYKGICVDAVCSAEEYKLHKEPTAEQLARGQRQGDPMTDASGKPLVGYRIKVDNILGKSQKVNATSAV